MVAGTYAPPGTESKVIAILNISRILTLLACCLITLVALRPETLRICMTVGIMSNCPGVEVDMRSYGKSDTVMCQLAGSDVWVTKRNRWAPSPEFFIKQRT